MANYLTKAAGRPSEGSSFASDAPNKAVDEMYRVQLYNTKGRAGATGKDALMISGNLYENFAINVSSEWETSFAQIVDSALSGGLTTLASKGGAIGNIASQAIQASGYTNHILGSARNWGGSAHLTFDLPLRVDAWNSTTNEIMEPMKQLLQSIAPDVDSTGILLPPGPNPVSLVTNVSPSQIKIGSPTQTLKTFSGIPGQVMDNKFLSGPLNNAKDWEAKLNNAMLDKAFTLNIGTFWKMFPAVVTNVTSNFSSAFEHGTGHPISVEFNIQVESYFTPTKYDFENWIKING